MPPGGMKRRVLSEDALLATVGRGDLLMRYVPCRLLSCRRTEVGLGENEGATCEGDPCSWGVKGWGCCTYYGTRCTFAVYFSAQRMRSNAIGRARYVRSHIQRTSLSGNPVEKRVVQQRSPWSSFARSLAEIPRDSEEKGCERGQPCACLAL